MSTTSESATDSASRQAATPAGDGVDAASTGDPAAAPPDGAEAGAESPWQALGRDLLRLAQQRLFEYLREQKSQGAERLGGVARFVERSSEDLADKAPASADYGRQAAQRIEALSARLKQRDIGDLYADANDFARSHPRLVFLGGAALGLVAARFLRSSAAAR